MTGRVLEGPKLKSVVPNVSIGQLFFSKAQEHGNKICQIDGTINVTETFSSVNCRSTRLAIILQKKGVTSNDVIGICSENSIDTVIPIIATLYLGAKVANFSTSFTVRHTKHLISLVSPKIIFVEEESLNLIEDSLKGTDLNPEIIVYGSSKKYTTFAQLLLVPQDNEEVFRPVEVDLDETAIYYFSSGTTGLPKAICHTHKSVLETANFLSNYDLGEIIIHFSTFYWVTAHYWLFYSFTTGASRAFLRSSEPRAIYETIQKYKVDTIFMLPLFTRELTSVDVTNYNISSLKTVYCLGAKKTSSQHQALVKTFVHSKIIDMYGMTECGFATFFDAKTDSTFINTKPMSCGKVAGGLQLKIVDQNEILGPNQKGEICVRTAMLMKGYYNVDSSDCFDEDGYLKTGDIGYYDEDDCVYVVSRIKELFKFKFFHVVPASIECVLLEHPAVKEAIVFGVPWGDEGDAPAACVVLEDGARVTSKEIEEFVAASVSDWERLVGGVTFVESLPKSPSGKLLRNEIRDSIIKRI